MIPLGAGFPAWGPTSSMGAPAPIAPGRPPNSPRPRTPGAGPPDDKNRRHIGPAAAGGDLRGGRWDPRVLVVCPGGAFPD
jgi:hypothetical protein